MDPQPNQPVAPLQSFPGGEALPAAAVPPSPAGKPGESLLDRILGSNDQPAERRVTGLLDRFLAEPSPARALALWVGPDALKSGARDAICRRLGRDLARLDELLNRQVNAILHHPNFQKLEGSWRGLAYLVNQVPEGMNIQVKVLNISWPALVRDLDRANDFDRSQLFRKVYDAEFGMPGGEPFGVLLGDYEIRNHPNDLDALGKIAGVAAAAFAPFIAAAHPTLLELGTFTDLQRPINLGAAFAGPEFLKWRALREREDARFVGLTLPRVLMRMPYRDDSGRVDRFLFREDVSAADRSGYLWANAAYAYGSVLIRAFAAHGWLAAIRAIYPDQEAGGLVRGLPQHCFTTDHPGLVPRSSTEVQITDMQEKELGDYGFLPLCSCPDSGLSAFYGSQSIQKPQVYTDAGATVNARLSSMLQYMFCVSRFAHYLKVMARDQIGSHQEPAQLQDYLRRWLYEYVVGNSHASAAVKAERPLREAKVEVRPTPGQPGRFECAFFLRPHFQLDQLVSMIRLRTQLAGA